MVTRRQISRYEIYMTSGWVCTCEGLVVDLQVNLQNVATFNSDREFRCVRLDCFSPSAESTPAFIVAPFSSILPASRGIWMDIGRESIGR